MRSKVMKYLVTCKDCPERYKCNGGIINKCYADLEDWEDSCVRHDEGMDALYGD